MIEVDVLELAEKLREVLAQAERGERVVLTQEGRAVAVLAPIEEGEEPRPAASGLAGWKVGRRTVAPARKSAVDRLLGK